MRRYPDIGVKDSKWNKAFIAGFEEKKKSDPRFFARASWPVALAEQIRPKLEKTSAAEAEAAKPQNLTAVSLMVKRIAEDGFLGKSQKFRYFFSFRNPASKDWVGEVTVTLLNTQNGVRNGSETFTTTIPAKGGAVCHIDANAGPQKIHGDWSVASFSWKAKSSDGEITGNGFVTDKYEDLYR